MNFVFPVIFPANKTQIFYHMIILLTRYGIRDRCCKMFVYEIYAHYGSSDLMEPHRPYHTPLRFPRVFYCVTCLTENGILPEPNLLKPLHYLKRNVTPTTFGFELRVDHQNVRLVVMFASRMLQNLILCVP